MVRLFSNFVGLLAPLASLPFGFSFFALLGLPSYGGKQSKQWETPQAREVQGTLASNASKCWKANCL